MERQWYNGLHRFFPLTSVTLPASVCTTLKHCTILRRLLFAATAVLLLFALSVERADFVQDYADLDEGVAQVVVMDDGPGDIQDNDTYLFREDFPCRRAPLIAETGSNQFSPAVQAIYSPELRPPALA